MLPIAFKRLWAALIDELFLSILVFININGADYYLF